LFHFLQETQILKTKNKELELKVISIIDPWEDVQEMKNELQPIKWKNKLALLHGRYLRKQEKEE